jgi:competence protein ComEA
MKIVMFVGLCSLLPASRVLGDQLPDAPGKAAAVRVCGKCHSAELITSLHQKRSAWQDTIVKMIKLGAQGSDEEFEAILNYVGSHFGPDMPGPLNINTARAIDMEAGLLLLRSQAKEIVSYRASHGPFQSIEDLRNVPGLDFEKIEKQKSRITF